MSQRKPKVQLGMPVYNGEAFIRQAIDSLLSQTYGDFELIISDNASTDGTEEICRNYAKGDQRVRYERLDENLGAVPNFNRVFERSNSEYFKWSSIDDICAPTFLERCVETLDNDQDVVWCHSLSSHIDSQGQLLEDPEALNVSYRSREAERPHQRFKAVLLGHGGCLDSYGLFRSEVLRKTALYHPAYGAEKVLMAEVSLFGKFREIPETLFFARVHSGGSGNLSTAAEQKEFMDTRAKRYHSMRLTLLKGYVSAIRRAKLPINERIKCMKLVMLYLFQFSKWKNVIVRTLTGRGYGGGNVERVKRIEKKQEQAQTHS